MIVYVIDGMRVCSFNCVLVLGSVRLCVWLCVFVGVDVCVCVCVCVRVSVSDVCIILCWLYFKTAHSVLLCDSTI